MRINKSLTGILLGTTIIAGLTNRTYADVISPITSPTIINGEFNENSNGWTLSNNFTFWDSKSGPDGLPGVLYINDVPQAAPPFAEQLIENLSAGREYAIKGSYKSGVEWRNGPSFEAKIDGEVKMQGGFQRVSEWTPFEFPFTATDSNALLRFEAQVGSDSDYYIDSISIVPEPASLALLVGGLMFTARRNQRR